MHTLVMTDIVDSTGLNERLGDEAMRTLWERHDALARALMRQWRGREIGRSDGFLMLFDAPADAVGFAVAYHRALAGLEVPLKARAGVHRGPVTLRENSPEDVERGATPYEVDGVALPVTARIMAAARGGQTLTTEPTIVLLHRRGLRAESHGFWRLKGLAEPLELFEIGEPGAPFFVPPDSAKAYRVVNNAGVWSTLRELPNSLPADRGGFVGRLESLKTLAQAFDDGARLVTLMGIGGVGKTRVALTYARAWLGDFPGGVWYCDLNAARGLDGIAYAVSQGLQLPGAAGDPIRRIGAAIAGRGPCLVVLDTFEQVARHAEATLGTWLEAAPQAAFLVTSREVLGIAGEVALVLPPLPAHESEELFRLRVKAAGLPPALEPGDEQAVGPLMALLDHLPLAIELAAARARVMSPAAMLQRMNERFKVLARRGERLDRQNTLRATLDWSWDLLGPAERTALMQLAVFENGAALDAAEAVIGPGLDSDTVWVPDLLQALAEKSLLRTVHASRFELLRAVQDYAAERLAGTGLAAQAQARHWNWFARLSAADAVAHRGVEAENLVIACRRAVAAADAEGALAVLHNAWTVLRLTGPFTIGRELAQGVAGLLADDDPRRAAAQCILGSASKLLGDLPTARACFEASIEAAIEAGDDATLARARCLMAQLELACGDADAAERVLAQVAATSASKSDLATRYDLLNNLGLAAAQKARWRAAHRYFSEALALAERRRDSRWQGGLHGNLAMVARAEGRREDARGHWVTALRWNEEVGDRQWSGNNLCNLGLLLLEMGDPEAATQRLESALEIARGIGHRQLEATVLCNLGLVRAARGDLAGARDQHARAVEVAAELGDRRLEGQARGYLGHTLSGLGSHEAARAELEAALDLLQSLGDPSALTLVHAQTAVARTRADDPEGARLALERARACAAGMTDQVDAEVEAALASAERALTRTAPSTVQGTS